ncbi:hypothetical protein J5U18_03980 [Sphingobacteriaceae bacterium WQ 2009]|uniref:FeoB-associated Cys-rich membrane protein n=1 Tax=Rhinopithecimicrobium faecis TaxID=2820698 RepID=A0A8T4H6E4_9SPHI|nr:hypothetical protein [Sphingobacteriaceae bacterium WQ 2009]
MENLTIQYVLVGIIVLLAITYLVKQGKKSLKGNSSCGKGCGCAPLTNCNTSQKK